MSTVSCWSSELQSGQTYGVRKKTPPLSWERSLRKALWQGCSCVWLYSEPMTKVFYHLCHIIIIFFTVITTTITIIIFDL